jgi:hypothetical protein
MCVPKRSRAQRIEDIVPGVPVIDDDGEIAVTVSQIPFLSHVSPLPLRTIELVERALRDILDHYGDPGESHHIIAPCTLYLGLVRPDFCKEIEIVDQILLLVSGQRNQVKYFAGHDRWIIHFLRRQRTTMIVEQSIDWRIVQNYSLSERNKELKDERSHCVPRRRSACEPDDAHPRSTSAASTISC